MRFLHSGHNCFLTEFMQAALENRYAYRGSGLSEQHPLRWEQLRARDEDCLHGQNM